MKRIAFLRGSQKLWHRATGKPRYASLLAATTLTNLVIAGLSIVTGVLAARLLGTEGRGELAAIQTWPTIFSVLGVLGLHNGLMYYSAREPSRAGRLLTTATLAALLTCIPFAGIGYLLMPWLLSAQGAEVVRAAREYLWYIPISILIGFPLYPLRGTNDLIPWNLLRPVPTLIWAVVLVVSLTVGISASHSVAQLYLIFIILAILPISAMALRRIQKPFTLELSLIKPMLTFGLPSFLSALPTVLNLQLDQMVMAGMIGPHLLGLYVVGVAWSNAASPILNTLSIVILPRVAGTQSTEEQAERLAQICRIGTILSITLSLGVAVTAPIMIPLLFGSEFRDAVPAAIILSLAAGVTAYKQLLTAGAMGLGYPRFTLYAELAGLFGTLVLLWLLLPPYQLIGAALASLISYLVITVFLIILITRRIGRSPQTLLVPTIQDLSLVRNRLSPFEIARRHDESKTDSA